MNVNHYETILILHPSLPQSEVKAILEKYAKVLQEAGAKILHESNQGVQNIAYPIQRQVTGVRYMVHYEAPGSAVAKLEETYRIDENVLRFLSIKLDKHGIAYHAQKRAKSSQEGEDATNHKEVVPEASEKKSSPSKKTRYTKKYCRFRRFGINYIDYKEPNFLLAFLNPQGKILPRRLTGNSAKAQRMVNQAIKRSRHAGYLPFVADNLK